MSLVFIDGFDHYDVPLLKWNSAPASGDNNMSFIEGRFAGQSISTASTGNSDGLIRNFSSQSAIYTGFAWKSATLTSAVMTNYMLRYRNAVDGVTHSIRFTASGGLTINEGNSTTVLASSADGILSSDTWAFIETYYEPLNSGGTTTVWVNGTQVVTYSGDNTLTTESVDAIQILPTISTFGGPAVQIDDLYVLNTSGTDNNSRKGECRIILEEPTADTSRTDFTPSTGTDNYAMVDEFPTIDGDATYVENGTLGATDRYTSDALTVVGPKYGVQVCTCAKKTDTATRKMKASIASGSTLVEDGTEHSLSTDYFIYVDDYDVDPNTGVAWTDEGIDALKFGFKLTTVE